MGREGTDIDGEPLLTEARGCGFRRLFALPIPFELDEEDEEGCSVDEGEEEEELEDFEKGLGKKELDLGSDLTVEVENGIAGEASIRAPGR